MSEVLLGGPQLRGGSGACRAGGGGRWPGQVSSSSAGLRLLLAQPAGLQTPENLRREKTVIRSACAGHTRGRASDSDK